MKSISRFLLIATLLSIFFAFGLNPLPALASPLAVTGQKLAIPSYFDPPNALWTRLENGAPTVGLAIINPNSGPGANRDPNYAAEVQRMRAKGIIVLGYVDTAYSARAAAAVKSDVNRYYVWYGVSGIFFDEASNDCTKKSYYQALYSYVKAKNATAKVVINPGTNTPECYITTADIIINFESAYSAYLAWKPSGWEVKYPASRFWHLVYATPQASLANAITLSKNRHAGWVYVTPDTLNNPWDTLPPGAYWAAELNLAKQ
ncbi:MAG: spherulation-specific family 4 protein [Anaerolineales bacterium]